VATPPKELLRKQLGLFDVFVISTGAMFSAGFFLLPGIAAGQTGRSVVLAYVISGVLVAPAMFSKAELATAMPRAGGTYYYLDRTLGPLVGTIGGIGTWLTLVLKSAFGLIGMGAYLALFFDVPVKELAIGFTIAFALLNIVGARESTRMIRVLVVTVLILLTVFLVHGLVQAIGGAPPERVNEPYLRDGIDGLLGTVGLVFVSYIGLTKVASLAEEVKNPDRNIPLGLSLSLLVVTTIYGAGAFVMLEVLGLPQLEQSTTPAADAARAFTNWIPSTVWVTLMVIAATGAFATMSNTGILAASRYPLAMARDGLVPRPFATLGRFRTPVLSIVLTCGVIAMCLMALNVEQVAKLAGALQLAIFGLVNVAVIVMRESRIEAYDPGFRSPLYPWTQMVGVIVPMVLVAEMGWLPVLFTLGVIALGVAWYQYYARAHIDREGAIFHVFARLGRRRFSGLDRELRDLLKEKGLRAEDPFDEVVARAKVIDYDTPVGLTELISRAGDLLNGAGGLDGHGLSDGFSAGIALGATPIAHGAALLHTRVPGAGSSEMVLARSGGGLTADVGNVELQRQIREGPVHAIFFVVSGTGDPGRHLRILAQLAGRVEDPEFLHEWMECQDEQELKETLLRDDRYLAIKLESHTTTAELIGKALKEWKMPEGTLVALIRRLGVTVVPRGRTVLREGDRLTIIGEPVGLGHLAERYGRVRRP
jgi:amino acid transporter/mannitol/fructose-specific phosphotransferase system IIA component (Ntr-type)